MTAREVYVVAGKRTPVGREGGRLANFAARELGAVAIRAALESAGVEGVDSVILGNVTNGGNVARVAALGAGLPPSTPALTVNNQCASGLTALRLGGEAIRSGAADVVVAGGAESVSSAIVRLGDDGDRARPEPPRPRMVHAPPPYADPVLGVAADVLAEVRGISREEQDAWARLSQERASERQVSDAMGQLLCPIERDAMVSDRDEWPGRPAKEGLLARLKPAFREGGTVTAGNTARIGDGATMLLLASGEDVATRGFRPMAKVVATAATGVLPAEAPLAAITAAERALEAAGLVAGDIDLWEVNEAFAVKVIALQRHFGLDAEVINVGGGALAFGHAFGASGATCLLQLVAQLCVRGLRWGLATIAGAGGVGEAIVVESVS